MLKIRLNTMGLCCIFVLQKHTSCAAIYLPDTADNTGKCDESHATEWKPLIQAKAAC